MCRTGQRYSLKVGGYLCGRVRFCLVWSHKPHATCTLSKLVRIRPPVPRMRYVSLAREIGRATPRSLPYTKDIPMDIPGAKLCASYCIASHHAINLDRGPGCGSCKAMRNNIIAHLRSENRLMETEVLWHVELTVGLYRFTDLLPCLLYPAARATNVAMLATTPRSAPLLSASATTVSLCC